MGGSSGVGESGVGRRKVKVKRKRSEDALNAAKILLRKTSKARHDDDDGGGYWDELDPFSSFLDC